MAADVLEMQGAKLWAAVVLNLEYSGFNTERF